MKTIAHFVRTTIIGGLFFLAPIVVLIVILAKAFDFAKKGLNAVFVHFPAALELSPGAATALTITILALVCLLAGLVAHTVIAHTPRRRLGVLAAVEDSRLRLFEAGERKRAGRRRDRETPHGLRAHGRGMAARRSNRSAGRRLGLDLRPGRAGPAFRVGLFLFGRQCSPGRRQDGRRAQLPQAVRRGRIRARRQLASGRVAPRNRVRMNGRRRAQCEGEEFLFRFTVTRPSLPFCVSLTRPSLPFCLGACDIAIGLASLLAGGDDAVDADHRTISHGEQKKVNEGASP